MPIYEFYCSKCHTIYNFLSRRVDTASRPPCPACRQPLQREISPFAARKKRASGAAEDTEDFPVDEQRMEHAMAQMAGELDNLNEEDPRQAAGLMRKFSQLTGMRFNGSVEEAIARMESGEDPEAVEAELGDALEDENPFEMETAGHTGRLRRLLAGPRRDPKLYELGA